MKKCYLKNKNRVEFLSLPCTKEDVYRNIPDGL